MHKDILILFQYKILCYYDIPLMKTLDWSVETLGLDYNSTGLCNHLFKPASRERNMT
jgi:hypothetical protein